MSERELSISNGAVVTACEILGEMSHADLGGLLIEYLSDFSLMSDKKSKTLLLLKEFASRNRALRVSTDFGEKPLSAVLVEEAIRRVRWSPNNAELWNKLERYLNLDGFALLKEVQSHWSGDTVEIKGLTVAMPGFVELQKSASEVDTLLTRYGFTIAQRHLTSAKDNIAQADWEAANSQCRTFLEALTDCIADKLYPSEAASRTGGLPKRQLLADKGFLSREKHEFGDGPKQAFLPGLAKLLHPDGSHPGITTQHDAMFRLQIVVVSARWLLKRLESKQS